MTDTLPQPGSYWVNQLHPKNEVQILLYPPRVLTNRLLTGEKEPELSVRFFFKGTHFILPLSKFLSEYKPLNKKPMTYMDLIGNETLEPRPSQKNQATDNLRKYGLEVSDKDLPEILFKYLEEAMTLIEGEGFLIELLDETSNIYDWWKETGRKIGEDRKGVLRQSALAKLTDEEVNALGLER
jgi:hypothetical protein